MDDQNQTQNSSFASSVAKAKDDKKVSEDKQQSNNQNYPQGQVVSPAGSYHKESQPITNEPPIRPSESEPIVSKEVEEAGVEDVSEKIELDKVHEKIGVKHAKESTPVKTEPTGAVKLPMSQAQAQQIVKVHKKVADSILWLAISVLRQIKIAHQKVSNQ